MSHARGQGFVVWALAHLPVGVSAAGMLFSPVAATLFAWLWLDESVSATQFIGMTLDLIGIYAGFQMTRQRP